MKKTLALILALCLVLAAVPVLAEDDLSGTWYMVMMGLTAGTFELNADGTCTCTTSVMGSEEQSAEGSWTTDGTVVTLSMDGKDMPLTYDGTDLLFSEEAVAVLGGEDFMSGMDMSMLSSLFKFSREPGAVTAAEFTAFQTDGTVPEGKTEEEIEAFIQRVKEKSGIQFSSGIYNEVPYGKQKSWDFMEMADMELYKEKKHKTRKLKDRKE